MVHMGNKHIFQDLRNSISDFFFPFLFQEDRKYVPCNVYGYVEEPSKSKANKKYDWLKLVDACQTVQMKKKTFFIIVQS